MRLMDLVISPFERHRFVRMKQVADTFHPFFEPCKPIFLIEQIKTAASPAAWNNAESLPAIYFDQPSAALIVLQSPPVQAAVQDYLGKLVENNK